MDEDAGNLAKDAKLDLNLLFSGIRFDKVREMGLAGAQPLKSVSHTFAAVMHLSLQKSFAECQLQARLDGTSASRLAKIPHRGMISCDNFNMLKATLGLGSS